MELTPFCTLQYNREIRPNRCEFPIIPMRPDALLDFNLFKYQIDSGADFAEYRNNLMAELLVVFILSCFRLIRRRIDFLSAPSNATSFNYFVGDSYSVRVSVLKASIHVVLFRLIKIVLDLGTCCFDVYCFSRERDRYSPTTDVFFRFIWIWFE